MIPRPRCARVKCPVDILVLAPGMFISHESGSHNKPHVHVRDTQYRYNASVSLDDGEVIVGNLPKKLAKLAKKKVLSDQEFFYNCWNTMTDGLKVDINHHYKIIGY